MLRALSPGVPVDVVANGVDVARYSPAGYAPQAGAVVFTGTMDFRPNVDGVCWFAEQVWPRVRAAHPGAQFIIAGRNPGQSEVDAAVRMAASEDSHNASDLFGAEGLAIRTRKRQILPRSPGQRTYFKALTDNELVFALGPAGTGKTQLAKSIAELTGARLIRLQCYEGLDEAKALYEWNYKKQLLRIQAERNTKEAGQSWDDMSEDIFSDEFLMTRPLLEAIRASDPVVLLIDEVDRVEIETEALLLEILSDFQVTIPEIGTIRAEHPPRVIDGAREAWVPRRECGRVPPSGRHATAAAAAASRARSVSTIRAVAAAIFCWAAAVSWDSFSCAAATSWAGRRPVRASKRSSNVSTPSMVALMPSMNRNTPSAAHSARMREMPIGQCLCLRGVPCIRT